VVCLRTQYQFKIVDSLKNTIAQFENYNFNPDDRNKIIHKTMAYQGIISAQDSSFIWACSYGQIVKTYSMEQNDCVRERGNILLDYPQYYPDDMGQGKSIVHARDEKI